MIFNYQINTKGTFELKFEEVRVDSNDNVWQKYSNTTNQWNSPIGTIEARWSLVAVVAYPPGHQRVGSPPPSPAVKSVGDTKKFYERPSVATGLGDKLPDKVFANNNNIITSIPGPQNSGSCKVWYHIPTVFDLLKAISTEATIAAATAAAAEAEAVLDPVEAAAVAKTKKRLRSVVFSSAGQDFATAIDLTSLDD